MLFDGESSILFAMRECLYCKREREFYNVRIWIKNHFINTNILAVNTFPQLTLTI